MKTFLNLFRSAMLPLALFLGAMGFATSQGFLGTFQNGLATGPSVFGQTDATSGLYFGSGFTGITKHVVAGTGLPVLSTCGTTPVLATGSNDFAGTFTTGSAATTCILTFAVTYVAAPSCQVSAEGTATRPTYTTTLTTLNLSVDIASTIYHYICIGKSGG